ncbi:MAG: DUF7344 domain-containing protein [archaeon]
MGTQVTSQSSESDVQGPTIGTDGQAGSTDRASDDEVELTNQQIFELLSSKRRRFALHYLMNRNGEAVDLNEITDQVAVWETGEDREAIDYDARKSVRNSLHQYHLPKLDEQNLIDYDSRRGEVTANHTGQVDVDVYMEVVSGHEIPWGEYFLALGVSSVAVFVGVWTGVLGFLGPVSWLAFLVTALLLSSIGFLFDSKFAMRLGREGPPPELKQR